MRSCSLLLLPAVMLCVIASAATRLADGAQQSAKPEGRPKRTDDRRHRLRNSVNAMLDLRRLSPTAITFPEYRPTLLRELKVDSGEAAQVQRVLDDVFRMRSAAFAELSKLRTAAGPRTPDEVVSRFQDESTKALKTVFSDQQLQRLRQLALQSRGPTLFTDADVLTLLKIRNVQQTKLRTLREEWRESSFEIRRKHQGDRPTEADPLAVNRRKYMQKAAAVLTTEQRQEYHKLVGKLVDLYTSTGETVAGPVEASKPSAKPTPRARGFGVPLGFRTSSAYFEASRELRGFRSASYLLFNPAMQQELKIDAVKVREISRAMLDISRKRLDASRNLRDLGRDAAPERYRKIVDNFKAEELRIKKTVLSDEQLKRLEQLDLQYQGDRAFSTPAVVKRLKLTTDQQDRLRNLQRETLRARLGIGRAGGQGNPVNPRKALEDRDENRKASIHKALNLLNKQQREEYRKLVGKPVDFYPRTTRPGDPST